MANYLKILGDYFLFTRITPFVNKGQKKNIETTDLPPLEKGFAPILNQEVRVNLCNIGTRWEMLKHILWFSRRDIIILVVLIFVTVILQLAVPILSRRVIDDVQKFVEAKHGMRDMGVTVISLLLCSIGEGVFIQAFYFKSLAHIGNISNILRQNIYAKSIRLSLSAKNCLDTGEILNFQGSDTDALSELVMYVVQIVAAIFTIGTVFYFLYQYFGMASLTGVLIVLLLLPISKKLTHLTIRNYRQLMKIKDDRIDLFSQVIGAMRLVKMYAWGEQFYKIISKIRIQELGLLKRDIKIAVVSMVFHNSTAFLIGASIFGSYLAMGGTLDAPRVFSSLIFLALIEGPLGHMTQWVSAIAKAVVGAGRIQQFLNQDEVSLESFVGIRINADEYAPSIKFSNYSAKFADEGNAVLKNIDFVLDGGQSLAIVGPVGGGKTALVLSLLNELKCSEGSVCVGGNDPNKVIRKALVPQSAFILSGSIKYNIVLCDDAIDLARLEKAVNAAQMQHDIKLMPAGIDTEIGENGINLSGGQKHRLNIARAIYHQPNFVLMDDPLSAVDGGTEKKLVDEVIFGCLNETTRVIVTHRLQYLYKFDKILFMVEGMMHAFGTFSELIGTCPEFKDFLAEHTDESKRSEEEPLHKTSSMLSQIHKEDGAFLADGLEDAPLGKLYQDEDRRSGKVNWWTLGFYIKSLLGSTKKKRLLTLLIIGAFMGGGLSIPIFQNLWLARWMNKLAETGLLAPGTTQNVSDTWFSYTIYFCLGVAGVVFLVMQFLYWFMRAFKASQTIHNLALSGVLASPMRFFDTTPQGRILNRFSRDLEAVEHQLSGSSFGALNQGLATLGALVLLLYLFPILSVTVIIVLFIYYRLQDKYRKVAREAKRLTSVARSPLFSFFKETLNGIVMIRCFAVQNEFRQRNFDHLYHYQHAFAGQVLYNRWFSTRIPLVAGMVFLSVLGAIIHFSSVGLLAAGSAGLALAYSSRFWGALNWCIRIFSSAESDLTSLERLQHFFSLPPEPRVLKSEIMLPPDWPQSPSIEFKAVYAKYDRELPFVLEDVNFLIPAGCKAGIVGRTGSGKSTIFQLLFRLINPHSGDIFIDGCDITAVPLERLRQSLAIIPQDPVLFRGTLRENIDRFNTQTDADLWQVLTELKLRRTIEKLPGGLHAEIAENGSNFSQGEKQLICLCRALLSRTKIVVLDEATANIDTKTDEIIQQVIRRWFIDRTIITIAHRLDTVKKSDIIIELSNGRVKSIANKT